MISPKLNYLKIDKFKFNILFLFNFSCKGVHLHCLAIRRFRGGGKIKKRGS